MLFVNTLGEGILFREEVQSYRKADYKLMMMTLLFEVKRVGYRHINLTVITYLLYLYIYIYFSYNVNLFYILDRFRLPESLPESIQRVSAF